jgi:t-SNARE complex subunit (syntaxin)
MSFGDIGVGNGNGMAVRSGRGAASDSPYAPSSSNSNTLSLLTDALRLFQRSCQGLKDKTTEMKRRGSVGLLEKNGLDTQIRELREMETKIKFQLDTEMRLLDNLPRNEIASRRASIAKLQKDFDRIKVALPGIASDAATIKVNRDIVVASSASASSSRFVRMSNNSNEQLPTHPVQQQMQQKQQQTHMHPVIIEQDIEEMIIEERNRDILKINQDLQKVNEIFRDMAEIVDRQTEMIDTVHEVTVQSHEEAKKGLEQVEQAAKLQPGCSVC